MARTNLQYSDDDADGMYAAIEGAASDMSQLVDGLREEINDGNERIEELEQEVDGLQDDVSALKATVKELGG